MSKDRWYVEAIGGSLDDKGRERQTAGIWDHRGTLISDQLWKEDAERIVQCVNAHDDLVAALKKLAHYAECQVEAFSSGRCYLDMTLFPSLCRDARTAIAKATGTAA